MSRILIVNADDCNLTPGVTRAILNCHDQGIVTSTTFLINLPIETSSIREIKKRKKLGVGLHLNVTLGEPVLTGNPFLNVGATRRIARTDEGEMRRQFFLEYQAQIKLFKKVFGRKPTHLDTHHQLHDTPFFFKILLEVARQQKLPIRRSKLMGVGANPCVRPVIRSGRHTGRPLQTTDYLLGDLDPKNYWRRKSLEETLKNLPEGISEIMCHPGSNDASLKKISSFQRGRTTEWRIFRCSGLRRKVSAWGLKLGRYGICYNF